MPKSQILNQNPGFSHVFSQFEILNNPTVLSVKTNWLKPVRASRTEFEKIEV